MTKRPCKTLEELLKMPDSFMATTEEIAVFLGVSASTVYKGDMKIPCRRFSARCIRYNLGEVREWMKTK